MFTISKRCTYDVLQYTANHYPLESCGVITTNKHNGNLLHRFYPIKNTHQNPTHFFQFDEQEWLACNLAIHQNNEHILCYVHSHINALPILSRADLDGISDFSALQMIVHLTAKNSPQFYLYRFNADIKAFENCLLVLA